MSVQERVARGARWLDEVSPGWRDAVALGSLDLSSATRCLLGQVFAEAAADEHMTSGYEYARKRLVSGAERLEYPDWTAAHGFDMRPWALLEEAEDLAEFAADLWELTPDRAALAGGVAADDSRPARHACVRGSLLS